LLSVRLGVSKAWSSSTFCPGPSAVQYICINDLSKIVDKLSHAMLCTDDTNVIVTSNNYNDLYKTVNVTIQFISEWFQMNQLVLNKSKKFAINFSWAKAPTHTLNIIFDNQKNFSY